VKARDYLFYIPYIVLGLIIAVPLSWLERKLGEGASGKWLWLLWPFLWVGVSFLGLWLAQRQGYLLPSRPERQGPLHIITRLIFATVLAEAIFTVADKDFGGLGLFKILMAAVVICLFFDSAFKDYKAAVRRGP